MRAREKHVAQAAAALLASAALAGCAPPAEKARAFQATSRDQLVGGPAAVGDVGDFVLENDRVRFVITAGPHSPGPGVYGGSLADADLQRAESEFRGGRGLDSLSEIFPFANLATPAPEKNEVTVERDGSDGGEAVVRVVAAAGQYLEALQLLEGLGVPMNMQMTTRYVLKPGERVLAIDTELEFHPDASERDLAPIPAPAEPPSLFDIVVASRAQYPGAVAGDFLFYGNKTDVFTTGYGFDLDRKLREVFNAGCESISVPVAVDAISAEGDRVSYAYASAGAGDRIYVPLFASSFTAVITSVLQCKDPGCLRRHRYGYRRLFAVGDGDVGSAMREIHKARGEEVGELAGNVFDRRSGLPLSGARVVVLEDPGADALPDAALEGNAEEVLRRIFEANRLRTRVECPDVGGCGACSPKVDSIGRPGIVSSFLTDRGTDRVRDGDFAGALPPGDYLVFARDGERAPTLPRRVKVEAGKTARLQFVLDAPGELLVRVFDEAGRPMPGKVTLGRCLPECAADADCGAGRYCDGDQRRCFPVGGCAAARCRSYERCDEGGCTCDPFGGQEVALADPLHADRVVGAAFAGADGVARLRARPGDYELVVSRGFEYDLARRDVRLAAERPAEQLATLHRVVDTRGWISGDFHVHGMNSHDAYVTHENRVLSMMGEGVELVSTSDHDVVTDLAPAARRLGAERFLRTQVGLEITTIEAGHFIGHPVRHDALGWRGGAYDWHGDFESGILSPTEILDRLTALGEVGLGQPVITVAHPRDGFFGYFDQYGLDPFSLEVSGGSFKLSNPLLGAEYFDPRFDAIELFNGKRFDLVRTPTVGEIAGFSSEMRALRAAGLPLEELERAQGRLGQQWIRRILRRTAEEQDAVLRTANKETLPSCEPFTCGAGKDEPCAKACTADADCPGAGNRCDVARGLCEHVAPCKDYRGVVDDWFRLLNAGVKRTGLGNSDTHTLMSVESGVPRNWVRSSTDEPAAIDLLEVSNAIRAHEVVFSYGPFVQLSVNGTGVGGTVSGTDGPVRVSVSVESPLWFDVDRVELYRNGRLWREVEAGAPNAACTEVDQVPNRQILNFNCTFEDDGDEDAWFVASALGLRGKDLAPVYTSVPVLYIEVADITDRAFAGFGMGGGRGEIPRQISVLPLAFTNPVWVDRAGDGFDAPVTLSARSPFSESAQGGLRSAARPLSSAAIGGSPLFGDDPFLNDPGLRERWLKHAVQARLERAIDAHHHRPLRSGER